MPRPRFSLTILFLSLFLTDFCFAERNATIRIDPIVSYYTGPGSPTRRPLDDAAAKQLSEGGWTLVWCHEHELETAHRHGLKALLHHSLLSDPAVLKNPERREQLEELIDRVKSQPALQAYFLADEPSAEKFTALAELSNFIQKRDPDHFTYINLLPTYASNEQLGIQGEKTDAYREHLDRFVSQLQPRLISYDHYQFTNSGDGPDYFLNLELIRQKSASSGIPFMNIVQASSWIPTSRASPTSPRVPNAHELRFLIHSSLAYGARAISYYVYGSPDHQGGMVDAELNPTPLYNEAKRQNPEFLAIAKELQPLESLTVMHAGMKLNGTRLLTDESPFQIVDPTPDLPHKAGQRARGLAIGLFGKSGSSITEATHAMIANLDYQSDVTITFSSPDPIEIFDASTAKWSPTTGSPVTIQFERGGGKLIRRQHTQ